MQAAVHETHEETGQHEQVVRVVGVQRYDLRPTRDDAAVRCYVHGRLEAADLTERWTAGESDTSSGVPGMSWTWWLHLADAHVLAAGFGGLIGVSLTNDVVHRRSLANRPPGNDRPVR